MSVCLSLMLIHACADVFVCTCVSVCVTLVTVIAVGHRYTSVNIGVAS